MFPTVIFMVVSLIVSCRIEAILNMSVQLESFCFNGWTKNPTFSNTILVSDTMFSDLSALTICSGFINLFVIMQSMVDYCLLAVHKYFCCLFSNVQNIIKRSALSFIFSALFSSVCNIISYR